MIKGQLMHHLYRRRFNVEFALYHHIYSVYHHTVYYTVIHLFYFPYTHSIHSSYYEVHSMTSIPTHSPHYYSNKANCILTQKLCKQFTKKKIGMHIAYLTLNFDEFENIATLLAREGERRTS